MPVGAIVLISLDENRVAARDQETGRQVSFKIIIQRHIEAAVLPCDARLGNSRVLAPVPGDGVWAAPCFFVKAAHRGSGLSGALLAAAADFARRHAIFGVPTLLLLDEQGREVSRLIGEQTLAVLEGAMRDLSGGRCGS